MPNTNDPSPHYQSLAVAILWSHYLTEEREHLPLDTMGVQVRFVEECLREARQAIEAHLALWHASRPPEIGELPRERELCLGIWCAAATGKVEIAK